MKAALAAVLALVLLVGGATVATSQETPLAKVTAKGVGKVKLGKRHSVLQERGLVGRMRKGCEVAGPGTRSARLRAPLKGSVDLTRKDPRRVRAISVVSGAAAKGVGIGASRAQIEETFPNATFDSQTEEVFGITLVTVPKRDGGRYQFALDPQADEVTLIGVPYIQFCD